MYSIESKREREKRRLLPTCFSCRHICIHILFSFSFPHFLHVIVVFFFLRCCAVAFFIDVFCVCVFFFLLLFPLLLELDIRKSSFVFLHTLISLSPCCLPFFFLFFFSLFLSRVCVVYAHVLFFDAFFSLLLRSMPTS